MVNSFAVIGYTVDSMLSGLACNSRWVLTRLMAGKILSMTPPRIDKGPYRIASPKGEAEGWTLSLPDITGLRKVPEWFRHHALQAIRWAKKKGVKHLGLPLGSIQQGVLYDLAVQADLYPVVGWRYLALSTFQSLKKVLRVRGGSLTSSEVAVLNGDGYPGRLFSLLAGRECGRLIITGLVEARVRAQAAMVLRQTGLPVQTSRNLKKIASQADIIIAVPSINEDTLDVGYLKPGCTVVLPMVSHETANALFNKRSDILVVQGPIIRMPSSIIVSENYPAGLCDALMAETMILALEGIENRSDYMVAEDEHLDKIEEMHSLASKHGFEPVGVFGPSGISIFEEEGFKSSFDDRKERNPNWGCRN